MKGSMQGERFPGYEALAVQFEDGSVQTYPFKANGGTYRFAWGKVGCRSSLWKVDVRSKGDVYVFERSRARDFKISLHQSRHSHVAYIEDVDKKLSSVGQSFFEKEGTRYVDKWLRSDKDIADGLSIAVTHDDILPWSDDSSKGRSVDWLEPPQRGNASYVSIQILKPGRPFAWQGVNVLRVLGMRTGRVVVISCQRIAFDEIERYRMKKRRSWMLEDIAQHRDAYFDPNGVVRQLYFSYRADHREIWDMAFSSAAE